MAQGKEIRSLQYKLKNLQEAEAAAAESATLKGQLEEAQEELCGVKSDKESFEDEKVMAVSGAKVVARWTLMREWLKDQTDKWQPLVEFDRYKMVKNSEAQLRGLPPPSFDNEPSIPGAGAAKEASPAASDDPAVSPTA